MPNIDIMNEHDNIDIHQDPCQWLNDHGDILYRYALMRLHDSELAEDIVQETFLSAIQSISSFSGKSSIRTWLIGILKNKIIDAYRKRWRETPQSQISNYENSLEDELGYFNEQGMWQNHQPDSWGNPKEVLTQKEFWNIFKQCNDGLPDRLREVFAMREMDNLKSEEICQVLNITATNYWKMMQRARVHLRQCLEKHWFRESF